MFFASKRFLRALARLACLTLHLVRALLTVALIFPLVGMPARRRMKQRWSAQLLALLGLRSIFVGAPVLGGLVVANHVSWLDIFVINAAQPVAFVSHDGVRNWPLIGWLAQKTETIFMARGKHSAAHAAAHQVVELLASGGTVAVFPEGATTTGQDVLPFRGALLQAAIQAKVTVQPLVLRYCEADGALALAATYVGATTLLQSLLAIVRAQGLRAHCLSLPPLSADAANRRALATECENRIRAALATPLPGSSG